MRKFDFIDQKKAIYGKRKNMKISFSNDYSIGFHSFLPLVTNHVLHIQNSTWYRGKDLVPCVCLQWFDVKSTQCSGVEKVNWAWVGHKGSEMLG